MFKITNKKGLHMQFENGWTVSVQFGPGNYCDNYNMRIAEEDEQAGSKGSSDAECAVWGPDHKMVEYGDWGTNVGGNMSANDVLDLMKWAASQP